MAKLLNIFTSVPWTYYLIAGLVVALLASGYLLKKEIETTGELSAKNAQLSQQITQIEKDKANLLATIEVNSRTSLEDQNERDKLKAQVAKANTEISKLKRLTKDKGVSNVSKNKDSDDVTLSDELRGLLYESFCRTQTHLCTNSSQPPK